MKKGIGIKVGVTLALLASFLFATPTQQYQVTAAKEKTEKTTATKRKANKKVTVKVKKYVDGNTTRFKLKNGKSVTAKYLLTQAPKLKKDNPYAQEAKDRTKEILKNAKKSRSNMTKVPNVTAKKEN